MAKTRAKSTRKSTTKPAARAAAKKRAAKPARVEAEAAAPQPAAGGELDGADVSASLDQLGAIITKALDVVETGMTLSVRLLGRLNSSMQVQAGEGDGGPPAGDMGARGGAPAYPRPQPEGGAPPQAPPAMNYIANRLPLFPGSAVAVPFTINNDSPLAPRALELFVEGFSGATHGAQINAGTFSVDPAMRSIAPMDFDKFTLRGAIPPDAPPDAYDGWVVVAGDEGMRIPVRLFVVAPG